MSAGRLSPAMVRAMRRLAIGAVDVRQIGHSTGRALWGRRLAQPLEWVDGHPARYAMTRTGVRIARLMGWIATPRAVEVRQLTFETERLG